MPGIAEVKIDAETLKNQTGNLTDEQAEAIALEAIAEVNADQKKKKPDDDDGKENDEKDAGKSEAAHDETGLSDEDVLSADDSTLSDGDKARKTQLVEKKTKDEEDALVNAKDDDLDDAGKSRKTEIVTARQAAAVKAQEEEVAAYAKENNISIEDAKAEVESVNKLHEKYKGDPKQLAKALLNSEKVYGKMSNEVKALRESKAQAQQQAAEVTIEAVAKFIEDGKATMNGKALSKDQVIAAYRSENEALTDTLDDDKVLQLAARDYKLAIDKAMEQGKIKAGEDAKAKRVSVIESLGEADKKFAAEVKTLIEGLPDEHVLDERFDVKTYVTYAKGRAYDDISKQVEAEKKAFGEKEYQRGLSEAKILGTKGNSGGNPPAKPKTTGLTDDEKRRAEEMFDNPQITKEKAYELYADLKKESKS
jgi:hypothetical protein